MESKKSKKSKSKSKLNNKTNNAFAPVNPIKPPKKKQTDFNSEDVSVKENIVGMCFEFAKTICVYGVSLMMLYYGGKMIYDGITDEKISLDFGPINLSSSFVGVVLFVLAAFILWRYKSNTTIKRSK